MVSRRKSKTKKLVTEPEPPVKPPIEPTEQTTGYQDKWNNGHTRTLQAGQTDPDDPKLKLLKVGDIAPTAVIDGKGVCMVSGSSPRLYFSVPNKDVEFSAEVMVAGNVKECYLVARSNHEDRPEGFGGYYLYLNFAEKKMYFKKEETHVLGYSGRLQTKAITFDKGVWYPAKIRVKNRAGDSVQVQGIFNNTTTVTVTDNGQLKGPPYTQEAKWCFIRTNQPDNVKYRNVTIKAI